MKRYVPKHARPHGEDTAQPEVEAPQSGVASGPSEAAPQPPAVAPQPPAGSRKSPQTPPPAAPGAQLGPATAARPEPPVTARRHQQPPVPAQPAATQPQQPIGRIAGPPPQPAPGASAKAPPAAVESSEQEPAVDETDEPQEPIPAPPQEPPKRKHSKKKLIMTGVFFATAMVLVVAAAVFLVRVPSKKEAPREVVVTIPRGLNAQQIGEVLAANKVISSPFGFKVYAQLNAVSSKLQPGTYRLHEDMQYKEVARILAKGPTKEPTTPVTVPEGFTLRQVADRLAADTGMSSREFMVLAGTEGKTFRYDFLQSNPTGSLEGYLFPKTYGVPESANERAVVDRMLTQFQRETAGLDWTQARKRGLSVHEVVTIASLIEREGKLSSERHLISAVIANRLAKRIALRIDATVQYGLPEWKEQLTYDDLKVESPYNTYLHQGLPPGPICNPGLASIKAALAPAKTGYLYYVLTDPRGKHTFTNTYSEFLRAKAQAKNR